MLARVPLDELRRKFWLLPGAGLAAGFVLGFAMVELDYSLELDPEIFTFVDLESARKVLQTIATVTVSVAGLSFSITIVALQLASQQLSPRVLKTFQADRLAQSVLAVFVGTFMYALVVLVKLTNEGVPPLSLTLAILGAVAAFALFVAFIHHIVVSLKASTVIKRIAGDGRRALGDRWPADVGDAAHDVDAAGREVARWIRRPGAAVRASDAGFVSDVDGRALLAIAERRRALVVQRASIGAYVVTGGELASIHGDVESSDVDAARAAFTLADERAVVGDVAYPIRQLADVALRTLSPSLNDATTARNAIHALADLLVRFAAAERPEPIRVGSHGDPGLVADAPELDELVRIGFEEVRVSAAEHPVVACTVIERLGAVARAAHEQGWPASEMERQARLMAEAVSGRVPNVEDVATVRDVFRRRFGDGVREAVMPRTEADGPPSPGG